MIYHNFPRDIDKERYGELHTIIGRKECSAFIGAGLSINTNFPDWIGLINILENRVEELNLGNIPKTDNQFKRADECKKLLGDEYYNFLVELFNTNDINRTTGTYQDILQLPFRSFITTNFDQCLIQAMRKNNQDLKVQSYPRLEVGRLHLGDIYHLHGIVHPENPRATVRNLILTESDFIQSYEKDMYLYRIYADLMEYHTVVFVGYGLNANEDQFFFDLLGKIAKNISDKRRKQRDIRIGFWERKHFAFLPYTSQPLTDQTEEDINREDEILNDQYNISVIRYNMLDNEHKGFEEIIRNLRNSIPIIDDRRFPDLMHQNIQAGIKP